MTVAWKRFTAALLGSFLLAWSLLLPPAAWAGPVSWNEVPPSAEGRQWWDAGSLRLSRQGALTVLSRFQPAPRPGTDASVAEPRPGAATLYVMELDCDQELYRDISVNGLPRFRAEWQTASGDALSTEVLRAACQAGASLFAPPSTGERG
ncbi:MAG: hypothetical protein ACKOYK_01625 [Cyanobium sp.]